MRHDCGHAYGRAQHVTRPAASISASPYSPPDLPCNHVGCLVLQYPGRYQMVVYWHVCDVGAHRVRPRTAELLFEHG